MINPFAGGPCFDTLEQLPQRKNEITLLKGYMDSRTDAVLIGPEGSGKSTLLRLFFNRDYCKMMAREKKTLIFQGEFRHGMSGEDTYGYFADCIKTAVKFLRQCGERELMKEILESLDDTTYTNNKSRFDQYMSQIVQFGYRMVFILDNFENFTSSLEVQEEHHTMLCGFLNSYALQMIVATNYDFNKTSLTPGAHNSTLLSRLSPNKVRLDPLNQETTMGYLNGILEERGSDFRFTNRQSKYIYALSGGVPLLLNIVAKYAFQALNGSEAADWKEITRARALEEARPILGHWCKIMSEDQMDLLEKLDKTGRITTIKDRSAAAALEERGIMKDGEDNKTYVCELLRDFSQNSDWMDKARKDNPLSRKEERHPGDTMVAPGECNLFISYKASTPEGTRTKDADIAMEVYRQLSTLEGVKPFLDKKQLHREGSSDYNATIFRAVETAQIFVYVCTDPDYLMTSFVHREWTTYSGELSSGRKAKGTIFGVTEVASEKLPIELRNFEKVDCTESGIKLLRDFVGNRMRSILAGEG